MLDGAGPAQTGAKATGIEVYASGVEVIKCSVKNIKAINPQDRQAAGFSCAQCFGVKFIKCKSENVLVVDQNNNPTTAIGYGVGFGWAPDPRPQFIVPAVDILYKDCSAKNCQVGFDSWFHIDSIWDDITSKCNEIPVLNKDQPPRTITCNPCSECPCTNPPECITSVTINNIAQNNSFYDVHVKECN